MLTRSNCFLRHLRYRKLTFAYNLFKCNAQNPNGSFEQTSLVSQLFIPRTCREIDNDLYPPEAIASPVRLAAASSSSTAASQEPGIAKNQQLVCVPNCCWSRPFFSFFSFSFLQRNGALQLHGLLERRNRPRAESWGIRTRIFANLLF
jgi:hypothetical protein